MEAKSILIILIIVVLLSSVIGFFIFINSDNNGENNYTNDTIKKEVKNAYVVITQDGDSFYDVAKYFAEKKGAVFVSYTNSFDEVMNKLSQLSPKYTALVISPDKLTPDFVDMVDLKIRE